MNLLIKLREKTTHNSSSKTVKSEYLISQDMIRLEKQIERIDQRITDVSIIAGEIYLNNSNDSRIEGLYKKIERLCELRNKLSDQLNGNMTKI